jgi:SnoaL-like domain
MQDQLQQLLEKDRIIDTINQLFISTDTRDWPTVRACFADTVHFDMTSLAGGSASQLTPEQIAAAWEEGLRPLQAIHHQVGNYRVKLEGEQATAFCYGTASHYRPTRSGRNTRVFVGSYDLHLRRVEGRWQIDGFRFTLKYLDGNAELEKGE